MAPRIDIGALFDEVYRIDAELGAGGFAVVYRATDPSSGQQVALKVLTRIDGGYDMLTRRRFEREGEALARLRGENVAQLLGRGETADGLLYLVSELVEGQDLSALLKTLGPLPPERVISILRQLLLALQEAHSAGILHRDIKPQNVRVQPDGRVKLIDFGIARVSDDASPSITRTGELIGTPHYMSPEQLTAKPLAPSSDLYSLGVLTLELLLGSDSLHGWSLSAQFERLLDTHAFPLAGVEPLGRGLAAILQRMTARDVSARYPSATAVLRALDELEGDRTVALRPRPETPAGRKGMLLLVFGVLLVAALVVVPRLRDDAPGDEPPRRTGAARALLKSEGHTATPPPPRAVGLDAGAPDVASGVRPLASPSSGCGMTPLFRGYGDLFEGAAAPTYIPHSARANEPMPLVILLHGNAVPPGDFLSNGGFATVAEEHRFAVVVPFGGTTEAWEHDDAVEQVEGIRATAMQTLCIDTNRVFVVAHEGGGTTGYKLACQPWVSGIAIFAYSLGRESMKCADPNPPKTPALLLFPTNSGWLPPNGGKNCQDNEKLSFDAQEQLWRTRNDCGETKRVTDEPVHCTQWECDAPVRSCRAPGGSSWPGVGGLGQLRGMFNGCSSEPADAPLAEIIWDFFDSIEPHAAAE